jgi:hypothetical protein
MSVLLMGLVLGAAQAQELELEPIERSLPVSAPGLRLLAGRSTVSVRHMPGATSSRVVITPDRWWEGCEVRFSGDASIAIAQIFEEGEANPWRCTAHFDVELAGPTAVEVTMDKAHVQLEDAPGAITVLIGRGSVSGSAAAAADVEITRLGRIELWDLAVPARARVGMGNVTMAYSAEVVGTIQAEAGWGRVRVQLPYGSLVDDQSSPTRLGGVRSMVPYREGHSMRVEASARLGGVRIETDLNALSASLQATAPDQTTADAVGM